MTNDDQESSFARLGEPPLMLVETELVGESVEPVIAEMTGSVVIDAGATALQGCHTTRPKREPTLIADLIELTKPRIVTMILITTVASAWIGMASPAGVYLPLSAWLLLLVGTGLVAGSAGAGNQVWERRIDPLMPRTAQRPLASRRRSPALGIAFTAIIGLLGTFMLAWRFGTAPALVGILTWAVYVLMYTPMKTRTSWNTTVGAIAGALPVFMGYTAAGGQMSELAGWMLFGVLACWQYPHFMAIAWLCRKQYAEAGFQMTTTVDPSGRSAAWQSIVGAIALAACGIVMCIAPAGEVIISVASFATSLLIIVATWPFVASAVHFARQRDDLQARKMMRWSLIVLPAVLLIVTLRMIGL